MYSDPTYTLHPNGTSVIEHIRYREKNEFPYHLAYNEYEKTRVIDNPTFSQLREAQYKYSGNIGFLALCIILVIIAISVISFIFAIIIGIFAIILFIILLLLNSIRFYNPVEVKKASQIQKDNGFDNYKLKKYNYFQKHKIQLDNLRFSNYCNKCGAKRYLNGNFCIRCGKKF